jgi:homoserine O-acetyltransferase
VTDRDAVRVPQRLLAEVFGIQRVKMVYRWSMGGMQAYHWAVAFPELVERIAVVCGSSRCAPHNAVFIDGVRAAPGRPIPPSSMAPSPGRPVRGFRAMGLHHAGWALSQTFYREEAWTARLQFAAGFPWCAAGNTRLAPRPLRSACGAAVDLQHGVFSAHADFNGDLPAASRSIPAPRCC